MVVPPPHHATQWRIQIEIYSVSTIALLVHFRYTWVCVREKEGARYRRYSEFYFLPTHQILRNVSNFSLPAAASEFLEKSFRNFPLYDCFSTGIAAQAFTISNARIWLFFLQALPWAVTEWSSAEYWEAAPAHLLTSPRFGSPLNTNPMVPMYDDMYVVHEFDVFSWQAVHVVILNANESRGFWSTKPGHKSMRLGGAEQREIWKTYENIMPYLFFAQSWSCWGPRRLHWNKSRICRAWNTRGRQNCGHTSDL